MLALPDEIWRDIFSLVAAGSPYPNKDAPGPSLTGFMRVCKEWKLIAAPVVYSDVEIVSLAVLQRLAALFTNESGRARATIGEWIRHLHLAMPSNDHQYEIFSGYLMTILIHIRNLAGLHDRYGFKAVVLHPLLHNNKATLVHLDLVISPVSVKMLPLLRQFHILQYLTLNFTEESESFQDYLHHNNPSPLHLPSVQSFTLFGSFDHENEAGRIAVMGYVSQFQFQEDCRLELFDGIGGQAFILLNELFDHHASRYIESLLAPAGSSILARAEKVFIIGLPSPELFTSARLPGNVVILISGIDDEEVFRQILKVLIASPHIHNLQLEITGGTFTWEPAVPTSQEWTTDYIDNGKHAAEFLGSLLPYVRPLLQKGVSVIDSDGKGFQDHFRDLLA